jgi:DNA-binding transcriptional LysR family regulator
MSVSLRHIEVFQAVMTAGSVTRAAQLLRTSQPTTSRELAALETALGLKLFDRVRGRLLPTAEAQVLFEEVRRSYLGLERIVGVAESIRQFESGQVAVACLPTFAQTLLPGACKRFLQSYPAVGLSIAPQESPWLEESLSTQRHDLGIVESALAPPGTSASALFSGDMVCVLPEQHRLLSRQRLQPADFAGQNFINLSLQDSYRRQLDDLFAAAGVQRHAIIETASAASVCAMVRQNLGLAIVNPLTALDEAGPGLALRRFSVSIDFQVSLVRPLHRPSSRLTEAFALSLRAQADSLAQTLATALA